MYAKTNVNVTFFKDERNENTDKVAYGRVSESIKTGNKDADGKDVYEYENWYARFVGKAREKFEKLEDKTRITLIEWAARNPYSEEKKRSFPYLLVMDFEINEKANGK